MWQCFKPADDMGMKLLSCLLYFSLVTHGQSCVMDFCVFPGSPCHNGGTCSLSEDCFAICDCPPGYSGKACETELDTEPVANATSSSNCSVTCASPCPNNGTCEVDQVSCDARCVCPVGKTGQACETVVCNINICNLQKVCLNKGECVQTSDCGYKCNCPPPFTGDICEASTVVQSTVVTSIGETGAVDTTRDCPLPCVHGHCRYSEEYNGFHCVCDQFYTGNACTEKCPLECGIGECRVYEDEEEPRCNCPNPFQGIGCNTTRPTDPPVYDSSWRWWVTGSFSCIILLVIVLFIPLYVLVQRRNIFLMKIIHYFQPFEDNDDKEFDAFISYKSHPTDEEFVYDTLYQVLQVQKGYKLCLHENDFIPGVSVVENIIRAVEKSRRTILVLSPRYLESNYARQEFEVAHEEMVKQKHKVIPLLFEDISNCGDIQNKRLTYITQSITYIEWPKDKTASSLKRFWKRMELSLPKKRSLSEKQSCTSPRALSEETTSSNIDMTSLTVENEVDLTDKASSPDVIDMSEIEFQTPKTKAEFKDYFNSQQNDDIFNNMRSQSNCLEKHLKY